MKDTLEFEVVELFFLSTGYTVLMCTPDKFTKRLVYNDNEAMLQVGSESPFSINIAGEDIHVRADVTKPVQFACFQTQDDIRFVKEHLGKNTIKLTITY